MLKFVTRMLEARNHEVRPFVDALEAREYIKSDADVGAVIASAELISMSGVELCWEARLLAGNRRPLYIILMSSNQDWHKVSEALDCGADDFIGKPPVAEELYARLRAAERLTGMQRELIQLATTDALTGVLNRRAFFERATEVCDSVDATTGLSVIMMDIDHFKRVNDSYGHDVGDTVVRSVAGTAAADIQLVGRLGGEEFAMVIEGQSEALAVKAAEALRVKLASLTFMSSIGPFQVTCSFGVSEWRVGDTIDHVLKRADVALYEAKSGGRNRVVAAAACLQPDNDRMGAGMIRAVARASSRPETHDPFA
jgi:diguanylate cyclase (GGDEF)-like protein